MDDVCNSRLDRIERRLAQLEEENRARHTHSTGACLEDALAVSADILAEETKEAERTRAILVQLLRLVEGQLQQRQYTTGRLAQLIEILQIGRSGPNAYPTERPAGTRPLRRQEP